MDDDQLLLQLFDEKDHISFRPSVSRRLGICAALFLSQALYWQKVAGVGEHFYKLRDAERDENGELTPPSSPARQSWEWELGGMTRKEQEAARATLKRHGLLEETLKGIPAQLHFRVNLSNLRHFLLKNQQIAPNVPTRRAESYQQEGPNRTNKKGQNVPTNTETTAEITSETTSEKKSKSLVELKLDDIFSHWKRVMQHPTSHLDASRRKFISARLRDGYTVPDLKLAIDGCKLSPFHMGQNDQSVVYDGIEVIFKSGGNVDKFIALATRPKPIAGSSLSLSERAALMDWEDDEIAAA